MTKHEKSCGAAIFKVENGQHLHLTVKYNIGDNYWGLVKGHVEDSETELETARREIYEEVGLSDINFIDGFRTAITYSPRPGVRKLVVFFLAQAHDDEITYLWDEHHDHEWLPIDAIVKKLTHESDADVVRQAETFLQSKLLRGSIKSSDLSKPSKSSESSE